MPLIPKVVMIEDVNISGSTSLHTCIGLALMQGVWWKFMSMADELPGKPNVEVAP